MGPETIHMLRKGSQQLQGNRKGLEGYGTRNSGYLQFLVFSNLDYPQHQDRTHVLLTIPCRSFSQRTEKKREHFFFNYRRTKRADMETKRPQWAGIVSRLIPVGSRKYRQAADTVRLGAKSPVKWERCSPLGSGEAPIPTLKSWPGSKSVNICFFFLQLWSKKSRQ